MTATVASWGRAEISGTYRASTRAAFCLALVKLAADATDGESLMAELQKAPGQR